MAKTIVNVGTIGHIDHGKSTLTSAIRRLMEEQGYQVKEPECPAIEIKPTEEVPAIIQKKSRGKGKKRKPWE